MSFPPPSPCFPPLSFPAPALSSCHPSPARQRNDRPPHSARRLPTRPLLASVCAPAPTLSRSLRARPSRFARDAMPRLADAPVPLLPSSASGRASSDLSPSHPSGRMFRPPRPSFLSLSLPPSLCRSFRAPATSPPTLPSPRLLVPSLPRRVRCAAERVVSPPRTPCRPILLPRARTTSPDSVSPLAAVSCLAFRSSPPARRAPPRPDRRPASCRFASGRFARLSSSRFADSLSRRCRGSLLTLRAPPLAPRFEASRRANRHSSPQGAVRPQRNVSVGSGRTSARKEEADDVRHSCRPGRA